MPDEKQSLKQKKIAFAQSEHLEAVIEIMKGCMNQERLVGDTDYKTVVNAVRMDTQAQLMMDFIAAIDTIKSGGLLTTESP